MTSWVLLLAFAAAPAIKLTGEPAVVAVFGLPQETLAFLRREALDREQWVSLLKVTVDQAGGETVPAVLGAYAVEGDVVRFMPLFPFEPGRRYRVVFRAAGLPGDPSSADVVFSLPAKAAVPTTIVAHVYPSADTLPENLLKLYIHFSAPMRSGDGLPFVRLVDASGRDVPEPFLPLGAELWNHDRKRYTVFFDPGRVKRGLLPNEQMGRSLRAGEKYALLIDQRWTDAEGSPLKESFRKEFRVGPPDNQPLDPATWVVKAPRAETRDPLVVSFPEPIDRGLLEHAIGVTSEGGDGLEGDVEIRRSESEWAFMPRSAWRPGAYNLVALGILEDLAGNKIGKPFEVDLFERVDRPDREESYVLPFVVR